MAIMPYLVRLHHDHWLLSQAPFYYHLAAPVMAGCLLLETSWVVHNPDHHLGSISQQSKQDEGGVVDNPISGVGWALLAFAPLLPVLALRQAR